MDMYEAALNRIREITIYETARGMYLDDKEACGKCNPKNIKDYISDAKEELINMYPDINWTTIKYGLDLR